MRLSPADVHRPTPRYRWRPSCNVGLGSLLGHSSRAPAPSAAPLAANLFAQSAREITGPSVYVPVENEPAPGEHKVKIELVDPNHNVYPGQVVTLKFTIPEYDRAKIHPHAPPLPRR